MTIPSVEYKELGLKGISHWVISLAFCQPLQKYPHLFNKFFISIDSDDEGKSNVSYIDPGQLIRIVRYFAQNGNKDAQKIWSLNLDGHLSMGRLQIKPSTDNPDPFGARATKSKKQMLDYGRQKYPPNRFAHEFGLDSYDQGDQLRVNDFLGIQPISEYSIEPATLSEKNNGSGDKYSETALASLLSSSRGTASREQFQGMLDLNSNIFDAAFKEKMEKIPDDTLRYFDLHRDIFIQPRLPSFKIKDDERERWRAITKVVSLDFIRIARYIHEKFPEIDFSTETFRQLHRFIRSAYAGDKYHSTANVSGLSSKFTTEVANDIVSSRLTNSAAWRLQASIPQNQSLEGRPLINSQPNQCR